MDEGWRAIDLAEGELLTAATSRIGLRDGFLDFVDQCARRDWPFHVISCGIDWYLRAFLPPSVGFTSYAGVRDDGWRVRLPAGCALPAGADFKIHVMRQIQAAHPGRDTVFIGDGRNDFPIACEADRVFALRGSTLAVLCRDGGVEAHAFESFQEIDAALADGG
jgi:2-hydroxy-3-keto-5-methylthiopentenyl-1-phosphate phosphatase